MSAYEKIIYEVEGPKATITLNKPEVRNALDTPMLLEIEDATRAIEKNEEIRVVVLTAMGEKSFCSGIDVEEVKTMDGIAARNIGKRLHAAFGGLRLLEKPVIAKIRGLCLGAGLELALSADFLIGSEDSKYGFPHMKIGIPSIVEAGILPQAVGIIRAKEMFFSAEWWSAKKSLEAGLLTQMAANDELDQVVEGWAEKFAGFSPLAMAIQKDIVNKWMTTDLETAIDYSINSVAINFNSEDQKEGMYAFLEKRKPNFRGR